MKTLAVCATYGRIPYLGRMLASFLRQEYDDKHLVIVNDDINVELCCARQNVTVINCRKKIRLSEKRNIGINVGFADVIFPWDDDDIYLPNRMSNHISRYANDVMAYRNISGYIIYGNEFKVSKTPENSISFRKSEWFKVNGYQQQEQTGEDCEIFEKIKNNGGLYLEDCKQCLDFVYQFGGVNYHLSCGHSQDSIRQKAFEQLKEMNLFGKKYWIEPNFEEFNKITTLVEKYEKTQSPILVNHLGDCKIDISHL